MKRGIWIWNISDFVSEKQQVRGREIISERMKERRKFRRRQRGDHLKGRAEQDKSCVVM